MKISSVSVKLLCFAFVEVSFRRLVFLVPIFLLLANVTFAQSNKVGGKIVNAKNGSPIVGATILEVGTNNSTQSNQSGFFEITLTTSSSKISVEILGYRTVEVLPQSSNVTIQLEEGEMELDEVVVVGYGNTKRSDLTGSVASMNANAIQQTNKTNAFQAMQGQVAGVNIQVADNKPGSGFHVRIRGANTINSRENIANAGYSAGQNPLFVVDGIFVNDISFLNPSDIERMDILKDASATAIYGSRGTNGVVIIETKRGAKGKVNISYDDYFGTKQAFNIPEMYQGQEFVQYFRDAVVGVQSASGNFTLKPEDVDLTKFLRPNELANIQNDKFVNWIDLVNRKGSQANHTLSMSGGTEQASYGAGLGYTKDKGTFDGESYERFTLRGNVHAKLNSKLSFDYNNYVAFSNRNEGSLEGLRSAYRLRPTGTAYEDNGDKKFFPLEGETFITNPLFEADNWKIENRILNYIGNLSLSFKPINGLRLSSNFSPNIEFRRAGEYRGLYNKSTNGNQSNTRADVVNTNRISWTWDNIVNYDKTINEDHNLSATFVYSLFLDRWENYQMQRRNFSTDEFLFYNIGAGSVINSMGSGLTKQTLESYTGRLNYGYKNKYLLTATGRYDGSSILAKNNKWAFFPSVAFAWRMINESFLQDQKSVSDLKLRLSYGETGNNGGGGGLAPLGSQALVGSGFTNLGDNVIQTAFITNLANQKLTWEKTKEWNVGLDVGFLNQRITATLDVYSRDNTGIIFYRPTSSMTGYSGVFENVGEANNKGVELAINSKNINTKDFKWSTSINFARNRNKVTKLYGGLEEIAFGVQGGSYIHRVGESIGSIYTFDFDGIWQLDQLDEAKKYGQQPGQVRVKDLDNNGVINASDRTIIGNNLPDWSGGITNTFNYKNVDLAFFVYTTQGVISASSFHMSHTGGFDTNPARFNSMKTNYWTPTNPTNDWYQPSNNGPYAEPLNYQDVSYVKIGYVTLGYNFAENLLSRLGVRSLRLYFTVQNPLIFTKYKGFDPETAVRNSYGSAHMTRIWMGGLNINF